MRTLALIMLPVDAREDFAGWIRSSIRNGTANKIHLVYVDYDFYKNLDLVSEQSGGSEGVEIA